MLKLSNNIFFFARVVFIRRCCTNNSKEMLIIYITRIPPMRKLLTFVNYISYVKCFSFATTQVYKEGAAYYAQFIHFVVDIRLHNWFTILNIPKCCPKMQWIFVYGLCAIYIRKRKLIERYTEKNWQKHFLISSFLRWMFFGFLVFCYFLASHIYQTI